MTPNPTFRAAREAAIAKKAREIVNAYEDKLRHVRGYYCRTDLLAITKKALREALKEVL